MLETDPTVEQVDPKLRSLLTRCAIYSLTGRLDELAQDILQVMNMQEGVIIFSGFTPTMISGEYGITRIKEIAEGRAYYDFNNNYVGVRTVDESSDFEQRRYRVSEDGRIDQAKDYDLDEIFNDDKLLLDALSKGFFNFWRAITEIEAMVGDITGVDPIVLQDRVAAAIKFLVTEGGYGINDIGIWSDNELIIMQNMTTDPFGNFNWRECLTKRNATQVSPGLDITYQGLSPRDPNSPFPPDRSSSGTLLQRTIATVGNEPVMSVVDCLRSRRGEILGISEETRIIHEGEFPKMLVGRSALWETDRDDLEERNTLECWIPGFDDEGNFEGYRLVFFDSIWETYVTHTISPAHYMGPYGGISNYEVPTEIRRASIEEVYEFLGTVGEHPFIRRGKIDALFEYIRGDKLSSID